MLRASVILLVVTVSVLADEQCGKLFHHGIIMKCCKGLLTPPSPEFESILKECRSLTHEANVCEREKCILTKRGYISPEGKLDIAKIKEKLEKEYDKNPALMAAFIGACADGDISKYGPADACDAIKFARCMELQVVKGCPEWSNDGPCEGLKDLSAECKKKYE